MLSRRAFAALLCTAACTSPSAPPSALPSPLRIVATPRPGHVDAVYRARLSMRITGAESASIDTETPLHVVEILGGENPTAVWFLSVSIDVQTQPRAPDGRYLGFTADLAPGLYRGAGTYRMTAQGEVAGGIRSTLGSAAYVQLVDPARPAAFARYDKLVEPCTLVVTERARTGTVDCPALGAQSGRRVSLRWSWELI